jgi:nitrogen-specific signal transduction histidine kinase
VHAARRSTREQRNYVPLLGGDTTSQGPGKKRGALVDDGDGGASMFFDVHPSVLFKLGSELIEDDAQALAELAKNAFDADATVVRVEIDSRTYFDRRTGEPVGPQDAHGEHVVLGAISVSDNGRGMDASAVERGWLIVSASHKRALKAAGLTTSLGRTPLGDKGLGRLGVQRLGDVVRLQSVSIDTQLADPTRIDVIIDWGRFAGADSLREVPIEVDIDSVSNEATGTVVTVYGLRDLDFWSTKGLANLQGEISRIISPYDDSSGLSFFLKVDGQAVELRRESRALLESAPIHVKMTYDHGVLEVETEISVSILQNQGQKRFQFMAHLYPDGGNAYLRWVLAKRAKRAEQLGISAGDGAHFVRSDLRYEFDETVPRGVSAIDPGPFFAEMAGFNLDARQLRAEGAEFSTFDRTSERIQLAKSLIGVRVFRDGFGIRLDRDWLRLGSSQTSGSSYYGLRPGNTAGYINISAATNSQLEETSSREAFRDTPAYRGFTSLLDHAFSQVSEVVELVRRDFGEYVAQFNATDEALERTTPGDLATHIRERLEAPRSLAGEAMQFGTAFNAVERDVEAMVKASESSVFRDEATDRESSATRASLAGARDRLKVLVNEIETLDARYAEMAGDVRLLEAQLELAEQQQATIWDMVALGMSAEVISHEVSNVSDRLRGRAAQVLKVLRSSDKPDPRMVSFADGVRQSTAEILRQVGRLDPMLRFRRENKQSSTIEQFLDRSLSYYRDRWHGRGLQLRVQVEHDATLRLNPGKFAQVIDNLVLNAEYWTNRSVASGQIERGEMHFLIDYPFLKVWDNGPGVDPKVFGSVFEPFVTTKPSSDGRGLGLYVVQQLLDSEGAAIGLMKSAEGSGDRDYFLIDLSGVARG